MIQFAIDDSTKEEAWKMEKWGCFSASEIYHLLVPGKKDAMWGAGSISYIKKVARQACTLYNERDNVETMAMKNGKRDEANAFGYLYKNHGFHQLTYHGGDNPVFKKYCEHSGTSPDAVAYIDEERASFGAEIKCLTGDEHFNYLFYVGDSSEKLKDYEFKYWVQCQFAMMTFDCDLWIFGYYNEYFKGNDRMPLIEIKKDDNFCRNLDIRLKQAVKIKNEIVRLRSIGYQGSIDYLFNK